MYQFQLILLVCFIHFISFNLSICLPTRGHKCYYLTIEVNVQFANSYFIKARAGGRVEDRESV